MHYKNGREAKNGDKVVLVSPYNGGTVVMGILYDATAGNDYCNGKIAPVSSNNPCPNLKEVLHFDDFMAAFPVDAKDTNRSLVETALATGELARVDGDKFRVPPGHPAFKATP
jgi:hypothetical protein